MKSCVVTDVCKNIALYLFFIGYFQNTATTLSSYFSLIENTSLFLEFRYLNHQKFTNTNLYQLHLVNS